MTDVEEQMANVEHAIIRILAILESDSKTNEKGLVEKVSNIDKSLTELLIREKVYKAKATTWGVIGGAVGTTLLWFAKYLLAKFI